MVHFLPKRWCGTLLRKMHKCQQFWVLFLLLPTNCLFFHPEYKKEVQTGKLKLVVAVATFALNLKAQSTSKKKRKKQLSEDCGSGDKPWVTGEYSLFFVSFCVHQKLQSQSWGIVWLQKRWQQIISAERILSIGTQLPTKVSSGGGESVQSSFSKSAAVAVGLCWCTRRRGTLSLSPVAHCPLGRRICCRCCRFCCLKLAQMDCHRRQHWSRFILAGSIICPSFFLLCSGANMKQATRQPGFNWNVEWGLLVAEVAQMKQFQEKLMLMMLPGWLASPVIDQLRGDSISRAALLMSVWKLLLLLLVNLHSS